MSKLSVFNDRNFHGDHSLDRGTLTKKIFITIWLLWWCRRGVMSESIKKGKFVTKIIFQIMLKSEKFVRKKRNKVTGDSILQIFTKVPSKFEMQFKKGMHFHLFLVGVPSSTILSVKNKKGGVFLLNEQNLLSMGKVICRRFLAYQ